MTELAKLVLVNLIGAAVVSLYGAFVIQLGTKVVAKFKFPYRKAYVSAFLGYVASYVAGFVTGVLLVKAQIGLNALVMVFLLALGFLIQAAVYSLTIKTPEGVSLSFSKACLVSLIQVAAGLLLIFVVSFFAYLFRTKF